MKMFEEYRNRLGYFGNSDREAVSTQSKMSKDIAFDNTQSYKEVIIDGEKYDARITKDVDDTVKTGNGNYMIEFREKDLFFPGTYIQIENIYGTYEVWLLIDVIDDIFFPKHLIKKCAYNLKWKNDNNEIIERWVALDDSYKLYEGNRNYGYQTTLPTSTMALFIPYDTETVNLKYDKRFLIDAPGITGTPDAYAISNRSAISRICDGHGIINLSLKRDQFNHITDNADMMIADYFIDSKKEHNSPTPLPEDNASYAGITYKGSDRIVLGTPYKEFVLHFYDSDGTEIPDMIGRWELGILPELEHFFTYEIDKNTLKIKALFSENLINYRLKISAYSDDESITTSITIKVVSGI